MEYEFEESHLDSFLIQAIPKTNLSKTRNRIHTLENLILFVVSIEETISRKHNGNENS